MTVNVMKMPSAFVELSEKEMEYDGGKDIWLDRYTKLNTTTNTTTYYGGAKLYDDYTIEIYMFTNSLTYACPLLGAVANVAALFCNVMNNYHMGR